jgi:hypothetical protein
VAVVQSPDGTQRQLDGPRLDELLAPAEPLSAFKTIADAGDRYGFDQPPFVVAFDGKTGRVILVLGARTFDGEGSYARRCGDDRIHLVTRTFFAAVERIAAEGRPAGGPRLGC